MNEWTRKSITLAKTSNYLDRLFSVYPVSNGMPRPLSENKKNKIRQSIENNDKKELILECIKGEVSPIKDSYIGFIKKDKSSLDRNPRTVNRLFGLLNELGYEQIIDQMERPAESNRKMGTSFKEWIDKGTLGIPVSHNQEEFLSSNSDMILNLSDKNLGEFARLNLGYGRNRGLDFLCRFSGKYIIGEAKFISASGGNQSNQFDKALDIFTSITVTTQFEVIPIAILDGVIYIEDKGRDYAILKRNNNVVLSSLLLRDFIFSLTDEEE